MTRQDWFDVIDGVASLSCRMVQFIGGEPTLHPHLPELIERASSREMRIELYSNLLTVRPALWLTLERFGVELATSYYSRDPAVHDGVTGRPRSHDLTRANIEQAVRRGIPAAAVHAAAGPTRAWLAGQFADRAVAACVPDDAGCRPSPCRPIVR